MFDDCLACIKVCYFRLELPLWTPPSLKIVMNWRFARTRRGLGKSSQNCPPPEGGRCVPELVADPQTWVLKTRRTQGGPSTTARTIPQHRLREGASPITLIFLSSSSLIPGHMCSIGRVGGGHSTIAAIAPRRARAEIVSGFSTPGEDRTRRPSATLDPLVVSCETEGLEAGSYPSVEVSTTV